MVEIASSHYLAEFNIDQNSIKNRNSRNWLRSKIHKVIQMLDYKTLQNIKQLSIAIKTFIKRININNIPEEPPYIDNILLRDINARPARIKCLKILVFRCNSTRKQERYGIFFQKSLKNNANLYALAVY